MIARVGIRRRTPKARRLPDSPRARPCELCGGIDFGLVACKDRRGGKLRTVICRGCGLVSHEEIPSDAELARYYAQDYRKDYKGEGAPSAKRVVRAWGVGQTLVRRLAPFLHASDHVFEIGAGVGCTVKAFELAGYAAAGIEPSEGYQQYSQRELLAPVRLARLDDIPRQPICDAALLVHVIEHLNSPRGALAHIRDLLRPGGRLYVECPNAAAPHTSPGQQFHYAHIYNFSPWTLRALVEAAGFRLVRDLGSERDKNLMQVFQRCEPAAPRIEDGSYERTLAGLFRYGKIRYHLRPDYLLGRGATMLDRGVESLTAKRRLSEILAQCRRHAAPNTRASRAAA